MTNITLGGNNPHWLFEITTKGSDACFENYYKYNQKVIQGVENLIFNIVFTYVVIMRFPNLLISKYWQKTTIRSFDQQARPYNYNLIFNCTPPHSLYIMLFYDYFSHTGMQIKSRTNFSSFDFSSLNVWPMT